MLKSSTLTVPHAASLLAPAKLNLSLRIIGLRHDGLHLIESIIVPIALFDVIKMRVVPDITPSVLCVVSPSRDIPADRRNLGVRAAELFLDRTKSAWRVSMELNKRIPAGAGLGGGSSDAATVLLALSALAGGVPGPRELTRWAAELGADVPFFVGRRPARVRGVGDIVEPLSGWPPWPVVVAYPGVPLVTADVYRAFDAALTKPCTLSSKALLAAEQVLPGDLLVNDLEAAASQILPRLHHLKRRLGEEGALGALMTGSGSAVFAVFERRDDAEWVAARIRTEGTWAQAAEIINQAPEVQWMPDDH
jgi:4-diphosphocytidyl-2-C-methyl-D-erythritol kinase